LVACYDIKEQRAMRIDCTWLLCTALFYSKIIQGTEFEINVRKFAICLMIKHKQEEISLDTGTHQKRAKHADGMDGEVSFRTWAFFSSHAKYWSWIFFFRSAGQCCVYFFPRVYLLLLISPHPQRKSMSCWLSLPSPPLSSLPPFATCFCPLCFSLLTWNFWLFCDKKRS